MIGVRNPDYFNFIKLVETVESSYMSSPGAGLSSETRSIGNILNRKYIGTQYYIPVDICNRYFSSRNKVKIIKSGMVHLSLFIGQLPGAKARIFINH